MNTNLKYPATAPVFASADYNADIIGFARGGAGAMAHYRRFYAGTGSAPVIGVQKVTPERPGEGPVDGWAPIFDRA